MRALVRNLKASDAPLWVAFYLVLIIAIGVCLGIPALLGNSLIEPHTIGWGGPELGFAIGAMCALWLRSAAAYVVIFVSSRNVDHQS